MNSSNRFVAGALTFFLIFNVFVLSYAYLRDHHRTLPKPQEIAVLPPLATPSPLPAVPIPPVEISELPPVQVMPVALTPPAELILLPKPRPKITPPADTRPPADGKPLWTYRGPFWTPQKPASSVASQSVKTKTASNSPKLKPTSKVVKVKPNLSSGSMEDRFVNKLP